MGQAFCQHSYNINISFQKFPFAFNVSVRMEGGGFPGGSVDKAGALGLTQREWMGREVGGGFRMGNTRTPMADSCQYMAKSLRYCKVISLKLKQINLKK